MANEKRSYYAIIPANVRYDEKLNAHAKLLYGEITALCNEKGYCWASNEYFADLYKVSAKSITRWINSLEQNGYITRNMLYREGTREILRRYLSLTSQPVQLPTDKNVRTYGQKCPTTTDKNVHTPTDKNVSDNNTLNNNTSNNKYMCLFNELWKLYPRKKEKAKAYKCYQTRIKEGYSTTVLLAAVRNYAEECEKNKTEEKYIKLCSTFLGPNIPFTDYIKGGDSDGGNNTVGGSTQPHDDGDLIALIASELDQ